MAEQYYNNQDFGKYNFLFHNCSDYTDAILDVADVQGRNSQLMVEGDSLISVPTIRVLEASLWKVVDDKISEAKKIVGEAVEFAKDMWNEIPFFN